MYNGVGPAAATNKFGHALVLGISGLNLRNNCNKIDIHNLRLRKFIGFAMCLDCSIVEAVPPYSPRRSWWPSWTTGGGHLFELWDLGKSETSKNGFFFCIQRWMRGPCPSIKVVTVEKQPPKPRVRGSMYPAGFAGRDKSPTIITHYDKGLKMSIIQVTLKRWLLNPL
jgi:hypothetical protein